MSEFEEQGVKLKCITEPFLDTTDKSSHSKFIVNKFAALDQLERDIIIERTKAGLVSAIQRGKILGDQKELVRKINKKLYFVRRISSRAERRSQKFSSILNYRGQPIISI